MSHFNSVAVEALSPATPVKAISDALVQGFDPATDIQRSNVATSSGHFLLMPSEMDGFVGLKVATVAPDNPALGLPRIQASYLLYDAATMTLQATLDGTALTTLRTPAVSIAAVAPLLRRFSEPIRVLVFGAGPQGTGHVKTLMSLQASSDVPDFSLASFSFIVRSPESVAPLAKELSSKIIEAGSAAAETAIKDAHVIICGTTARTPLFDSSLVRDDAILIAVGSHEPDARELDANLLRRSTVVVEDPATALREAGDVVMAVAEGAISAADLIPMKDIVTGGFLPPKDRPVVFKSVGMSWQDLVVARSILERS